VAIDGKLSGERVDVVRLANEDSARQATSHLYEQGYRRVACITGPRHVSTAAERLRGYQRAARDAGAEPDPELMKFSTFRADGGFALNFGVHRQHVQPRLLADSEACQWGLLACRHADFYCWRRE
jgi:DNA-binding LacI/PurR family transcriptional regulator